MRDEHEALVSLSALAPAPTLASSLMSSELSEVRGDAVETALRGPWRWANSDQHAFSGRWLIRVVVILIYGPVILLVVLSLGSGWAFPNLLPDRMDGAPWRFSFFRQEGLLRAAMTSALLSLSTAVVSTTAGFLLARRIRHRTGSLVLYLLYMPFVVSPVVAGVCLYDLVIRLRLAGSVAGVLLVQCMFATSFSAIYFREVISHRLERTENLIRTLGGSSLTIWQHAIWPQCRGVIVICLIQTALYSWLDYGLVSVIGGGNVVPLTVRLYGYIRDGSTNQAAFASLLLMLPAIFGLLLTFVREWFRGHIRRTPLRQSEFPGDAA